MDAVYAEVAELIRKSLDERAIRRKDFLDRWRETAGWPASYAQAGRRLAQWLDPDDCHRFPVDALPDLIRALGSASFLDPLLALEAKVQRERRQHDRAATRERFAR